MDNARLNQIQVNAFEYDFEIFDAHFNENEFDDRKNIELVLDGEKTYSKQGELVKSSEWPLRLTVGKSGIWEVIESGRKIIRVDAIYSFKFEGK
jgi:hypothetical protein